MGKLLLLSLILVFFVHSYGFGLEYAMKDEGFHDILNRVFDRTVEEVKSGFSFFYSPTNRESKRNHHFSLSPFQKAREHQTYNEIEDNSGVNTPNNRRILENEEKPIISKLQELEIEKRILKNHGGKANLLKKYGKSSMIKDSKGNWKKIITSEKTLFEIYKQNAINSLNKELDLQKKEERKLLDSDDSNEEEEDECVPYGYTDTVEITEFICDEVTITETEYTSQDGANNPLCSSLTREEAICICRRDYTGSSCSTKIPPICSLTPTSPPASSFSCTPDTSFSFYDNTRYGIPPCNFLSPSDTLSLKFLIHCTIDPYAIEGPSHPYYQVPTDYVVQDHHEPFEYFINTEEMCSTDAFSVKPQLQFLNFNRVLGAQGFEGEEISDYEGISGEREGSVVVDMGELVEEVCIAGRWYFELWPDGDLYAEVFHGVFDKEGYEEPKAQFVMPVWAVFLIVVLVLGFVVGAVWFVIWRLRKRKQVKLVGNLSQETQRLSED